jgi:hypothetical protein
LACIGGVIKRRVTVAGMARGKGAALARARSPDNEMMKRILKVVEVVFAVGVRVEVDVVR